MKTLDLQDLHWYNIPNLAEKKSTKTDFFQTLYKKTELPSGTPAYIYMYNGRITDLENRRHDKRDIDILNSKGLHIFLYEPLCSRLRESVGHNQSFYSEFEFKKTDTSLFSDELESIKIYTQQNFLTNVTVHTGDYNVELFYDEYKTFMNLICDDLFLKNQVFLEEICRDYKENDVFQNNFICLNWRYTKHRHILASYLISGENNVSWYYKCSYKDFKESLWFDFDKWKDLYPLYYDRIRQGVDVLNEKSPISLDLKANFPTTYKDSIGKFSFYPSYVIATPGISNQSKNNLVEFYSKTFCDIVTESRFAQPTANVSEKVFMSMHYLRPFILIAPPKSLTYLKTLGFKTFSEFWDESYDDEYNHENRLIKIFKVIDLLSELTIVSKASAYKKIFPILEHNVSVLQYLYSKRM